MTAATALQIAANRANVQLSTGPRTTEGKLASSANARSHGLTTRQALVPGEDPAEYQLHHQNYLDHYQPKNPIDQAQVIELADLKWRLRRVPSFESELLNLEVQKLKTDPELKPLIENLDSDSQVLALAFTRLVQSKVLPNLLNQEARLARRVEKIERRLELSIQPRQFPPAEPVVGTEEIENRKIEPNPRLQPIRVPHKPGRNEPCPCHSGLKFKRCCLNQSAIEVKPEPQ